MDQDPAADMQDTTRADRVAVLGTGAIGTAVATTLLRRGHPVRVWNRSDAAARALVRHGAVQAPSAAAAVGGSGLALVCLTDFAAACEVRGAIAPREGSARPATVVTLTTGAPEGAAELSDHLRARGLAHVDAGVQTAPEDIGTERAVLLYSGSEPGFRAHRLALEALGTPTWLGEDVRAAATWDLALFGLWYDAQLGLLRAFGMLPDTPEARDGFAAAAKQQLAHVVDGAAPTAAEINGRDYPRGPASLDEHLVVLQQLRSARTRNRLGDGGLDTPLRLGSSCGAPGTGIAASPRSPTPTSPPLRRGHLVRVTRLVRFSEPPCHHRTGRAP